jgi:hypothetical protein
MNRRVVLAVAIALSIVAATDSFAIPRFSLLTGTKCSACHFNPQGSGIRTELGWSAMNQVGLWQWKRPTTAAADSSDLGSLLGESTESASTEIGTNTWFGGKVIPGFDARGQIAKSSTTGKRIFIPMQFATSIAYMPMPELSLYTNINIASIEERIRGGNLFPGQTDFDAAIQYAPSPLLPSVRVGMIQPSVGIRQDDHTEYVRREAAINGSYLMPAYYNDVGAELTYEGVHWLTVNAGIFNAKNFSELDPTIVPGGSTISSNFSFDLPSVSARVVLWPQLLESGINTELGASILQNGEFQMINGFVGFGLANKATIFAEGMYSTNAADRRIRNWSVIGTYELFDWLSAHWRYDWGQTEYYPGVELGYAQAFLFGLEFYPLPYVELRPEYRSAQKNVFYGNGTYTAQYTIQLHLFY